ncbi:MAG: hypothetical protein CMK32_07285 [Porticoccaceae bacterium]|nr:hypothetical protein [Porticoccaceae bacterium]
MANTVTNFRRQKGFTLVEALVALLVVGIAYTGVSAAIAQFVDQRHRVMTRHISHRVAWNRLVEQYLIARDQRPNGNGTGERRGEVEQFGARWHWVVTREKTTGGDLVRYTVDVRQGDSPSSPAGALTAFFSR